MMSTAVAHTLGPFIIVSFLHPLENREEAQKSRATCLRSHSLSIGRLFRPSYPWLAFNVKALPWLLGHRQLAYPKLKFHLQQVFQGLQPGAFCHLHRALSLTGLISLHPPAGRSLLLSAVRLLSYVRGAEHGTWHGFC